MKIEELIAKLEELLVKMDQGVTIDEGIDLFEKGMEIAKQCYDLLNASKGKLEVLTASLNNLS